MDKKINLSQLADMLSQQGGMSKSASEQFVKTFFDIISNTVLQEGLVKVKGFGTFKLLQMEDRESVNVNTGERFTIEGHQKISFTPDAELKERINKPFAAFEIVEITPEQADKLGDVETTTAAPESNSADEPEETVAPEPVEEIKTPQVKDITQKGITRFFLRLLVWIFSLVLIAAVALYLLWPVVGDKVTEFINDKFPGITLVEPVRTPVRAPKPQEIKPNPVVEQVEVVTIPADTTTIQLVVAPDTVQTIVLSKADQDKKLALFTEADTVNFRITGTLAAHKVQKGESMVKLAFRYYGSKKLWPYIARYNKLTAASQLIENSTINIPRLAVK